MSALTLLTPLNAMNAQHATEILPRAKLLQSGTTLEAALPSFAQAKRKVGLGFRLRFCGWSSHARAHTCPSHRAQASSMVDIWLATKLSELAIDQLNEAFENAHTYDFALVHNPCCTLHPPSPSNPSPVS